MYNDRYPGRPSKSYEDDYSWRRHCGFDKDIGKFIEDNALDEPVAEIREQFDETFLRSNNSNPRDRDPNEVFLNHYFDPLRSSLPEERKKVIYPFSSFFVRTLLHNKHVALIGDSYLIQLLQNDCLLEPGMLKAKAEFTHLDDRQIDSLPLDADKIFRQAREYFTEYHLIQYLFTTRAMKEDVEKFLLTWQKTEEFPDVVILNSAIWDLTRYYDNDTDMSDVEPYQENPMNQIEDETASMREYMERISILMRRLRLILPPHTQVIWLLMPWPMPVGNSSLFSRNLSQRKLHRSIYLDGNYRAAQIVSSAGYDVLDIGFYMRNHSLYPLRIHDGIHWGATGTRLMTQLIIGHLAKNLTIPIKGPETFYLEKCVQATLKKDSHEQVDAEFLRKTNRQTPLDTEDVVDEDIEIIGNEEEGEWVKVKGEHNNTEEVKPGNNGGPWFNELQRNLANQLLENMNSRVKEAISQDIKYFRMSELIRLKSICLSKDERDTLDHLAEGLPLVKYLMDENDYKPQNIAVKPKHYRYKNF